VISKEGKKHHLVFLVIEIPNELSADPPPRAKPWWGDKANPETK
jgi:hypothetical protein